jgi:hypothetical protein
MILFYFVIIQKSVLYVTLTIYCYLCNLLMDCQTDERPLFFVCHSTGGLIVKLALIEARSRRSSVFGDCYGVSFFGKLVMSPVPTCICLKLVLTK